MYSLGEGDANKDVNEDGIGTLEVRRQPTEDGDRGRKVSRTGRRREIWICVRQISKVSAVDNEYTQVWCARIGPRGQVRASVVAVRLNDVLVKLLRVEQRYDRGVLEEADALTTGFVCSGRLMQVVVVCCPSAGKLLLLAFVHACTDFAAVGNPGAAVQCCITPAST